MQVLDRKVVELSDRAMPDTRQPYHAKMSTLETDAAKIDRRRKAIVEAANRSVSAFLKDCRDNGHRVAAAGLVVGSDIDPAKVANPHIRAHALEGRLFRTVLEDALRSQGLGCLVIVEKHAYATGAEFLRRSQDDLRRVVGQLGRSLGGPWRADEKTAALAAWVALAEC
jgi:hypothetical protein